MAFCPEHPKWDQDPKFTPLSETMSSPHPNKFNKQNNNFARASHFFVHFFPALAPLRRENA